MPEHCGCLHEMETWRALQPVESCRMGREGKAGRVGRGMRERREGRGERLHVVSVLQAINTKHNLLWQL